ncbi:MAG TPA: response regulator [Longimicrobiales bacterium]|nr:response regulator [Longimicrobiales bacterium]
MGSTTRTVLVVADDAPGRLVTRRMLAEDRPDYVVLEAGTGEQGLAACREHRPDCILLDHDLPDMDGAEFLRRLAGSDGRGPALAVAVFADAEDSAVASRVFALGAQDYVVKGTVTGYGLVRVVENAIDRLHVHRELEEKRAALELRQFELEMVRDELQARLADLSHATRAKDQFIAVMSHEMRTPLNAILGYADLMDMGIGGELPEGQRRNLERIRLGGRHLLDLINDVLDFARADGADIGLDLRPVNVVAVVEEVIALLESQAQAKGVQLRLERCGDGLPPVQADLQRLRQVVTNVVANAIKFTERGHVAIRCEHDDDVVRVRVEDTGIGISPDVLPLVFKEFYQADARLTRERGGSGLGLPIAQRLTRLMGGDVVARSALGQGSTFTIVLRALPAGTDLREEDVAAHAARMEARAAQPAGAPDAPVTVVAFGRAADALEELARRISTQVHLVWTTATDEVATLARRERPSLVVLDISAGDEAAWRVAHALQEMPELSNTAVLLLPAIPAPLADEATGGFDLGWVALVPKPFTAEQLTQAVHRAVWGGAAQPGSAAGRYDILVVDDDEDSRRVATRFLAGARADVREAPDGETALAAMRRRPPDVVVLDLMMPVLDGFGVLATMRADPLLARIPVVVLSAKSLSEAERQFLARTAVRVLQKGEHRLADVAALVMRAAAGAARASQGERVGVSAGGAPT